MGRLGLHQGQAPNYQIVRGRGGGVQGGGRGPTCQVQKSTMACRRVRNVSPLHQPRLAKDMARTRSHLLGKLLAVRWDGEGVWCSRLALGRQSEQDEGETPLKHIHYVQTLTSPLAAASSRGPAPRPGAGTRGKAGCPTPPWYSRGRGGSADGASRYKNVENS